jgi:hypothetical protein
MVIIITIKYIYKRKIKCALQIKTLRKSICTFWNSGRAIVIPLAIEFRVNIMIYF